MVGHLKHKQKSYCPDCLGLLIHGRAKKTGYYCIYCGKNCTERLSEEERAEKLQTIEKLKDQGIIFDPPKGTALRKYLERLNHD